MFFFKYKQMGIVREKIQLLRKCDKLFAKKNNKKRKIVKKDRETGGNMQKNRKNAVQRSGLTKRMKVAMIQNETNVTTL